MARNTRNISRSIHKTYIVNHHENFKRIVLNRDYKTLKYSIDFFVAGYQYNDGSDIIELISKNEPLNLVHEHFNPYDPFAVAVYTKDFIRLGYVPNIISSFIAYNIDNEKHIKALIKEVRNKDMDSDDTKIEVRVVFSMDESFAKRSRVSRDNISS